MERMITLFIFNIRRTSNDKVRLFLGNQEDNRYR